MSSRLKILPKKSYCPWSEENVQKVLRDEEKHAREAEATNQQKKRDSQDAEDGINNLAPTGHFSLFAKEEKEAHLDQEMKIKGKDRKKKQQQQRRPFDQSTSAAMDAAVGLKSREHKHSRRDAAVKQRLDPMTEFCRNHQDEKNDPKRVDREDAFWRPDHKDAVDDGQDGKHSKSERDYRGRSHKRQRRKRSPSSSSSSSSSSSEDSLSSSSSRRRRRKRRRGDSKSRKSSYTSSSSSSSSDGDDPSHHKEDLRRKRRHSKSRNKRKSRSRSKNTGLSAAMLKKEKAKHELLLKCAQREEQERLRQGNLQRYR